MAPRLFLIRHGEAIHNVADDHTIPDPTLTSLGVSQSAALATNVPSFFSLLSPTTTVILTSPFHRTLLTTLVAFSTVLPPFPPSACIPLVLMPELQETGSEPCDTGAPLPRTQEMFAQDWLDWSRCTEGWNEKEGEGFFSADLLKQAERARWVRRFIREREEEVVVVVTHHGFLRAITKTPRGQCNWPNADVREYAFCDPSGKDEEADVERVLNAVL